MLNKQDNSTTMAAGDICHPVREITAPDPELMTIVLGRDPVPGFEFPVAPEYPTVILAKAECADELLWVENGYIAGRKDNGLTLGFMVDRLLPWYSEAIDRYLLPEGWSLKDWVFTTPDGDQIPYVPGFRITNGEPVFPAGLDTEAVLTRFKVNRARVNNYVGHVFSNDPDGHSSIPATVDQTEKMMYNLAIPRNIVKTATDTVFPGENGLTTKQERQALTAWLCTKLETPVIVFDNPFKFPQ